MYSSCVLFQEHTENHADDPTKWWTPQLTPNPTTARDAYGCTAALRGWLEGEGLWNDADIKPADPKEAFERACRQARSPATSAMFRQVISKISLTSCVDPAFLRLTEILQRWFGAAN